MVSTGYRREVDPGMTESGGTTTRARDSCRPGEVRGLGAVLGWGVPVAMVVLGSLVQEWMLPLWTPALLVMGGTCVINAARCGRLHCYATGPILLLGGLMSGLVWLEQLPSTWIAGIAYGILLGVMLAYATEWLLGRRYVRSSGDGM